MRQSRQVTVSLIRPPIRRSTAANSSRITTRGDTHKQQGLSRLETTVRRTGEATQGIDSPAVTIPQSIASEPLQLLASLQSAFRLGRFGLRFDILKLGYVRLTLLE